MSKEIEHKAGFLKIPENIDELPLFKGSKSMVKFVAPKSIDNRDYCTPTEDQGNKPMCAAYSGTSMVENILWRKNDYPENIDPEIVYKYAKSIDGYPNSDGTTLNAALQFFIDNKYFSKESQIQIIRGSNIIENIKYAIHKFGCVHCGFNITTEWESIDSKNTAIKADKYYPSLGGHAVLGCGYDSNGLYIQNSWGEKWGAYGFALVTWEAVKKQFIYGAVISHSLDGMKMNLNY